MFNGIRELCSLHVFRSEVPMAVSEGRKFVTVSAWWVNENNAFAQLALYKLHSRD